MKTNITRIILAIILIVSTINAWWFVALPVAVLGIWLFPLYVEIILAGIIFDALFGMVNGLGLWSYIGTIVSVIVFAVVVFLRGIIRK